MDFYPDYFTREELILALANQQFVPQQLAADNLFNTRPIAGTLFSFQVEPDDDVAYAANTARGAPAEPLNLDDRDVVPFKVPSMKPKEIPILADSVLNARASGIDAQRMTIEDERARALRKLRRYADLNHEYRRIAVLNTPTNVLGSAPAAVQLAFSSTDATMRAAIHTTVKVPMETALDGLAFTGLTAYCDETYWAALLASKSINETYMNYAAAAELRNEVADSFSYGGVTWKRYRAGGGIAITTGQAKVVPTGVDDLFLQVFAPDDTVQSVGAGELGQPYYLNAYPIDEDKGWKLKISSHPLMLCTRPTCVLSLKLTS